MLSFLKEKRLTVITNNDIVELTKKTKKQAIRVVGKAKIEK